MAGLPTEQLQVLFVQDQNALLVGRGLLGLPVVVGQQVHALLVILAEAHILAELAHEPYEVAEIECLGVVDQPANVEQVQMLALHWSRIPQE